MAVIQRVDGCTGNWTVTWRSSLIVLAVLCPACGPLGAPARVKAPPGNYDLVSGPITWSPDPSPCRR